MSIRNARRATTISSM